MAADKASIEAVVVFTHKDDGKQGSTKIMEAVPCGDEMRDKKEIIEKDEEEMSL